MRLRFGNLTSASLTSANARLEWGSVDTKGLPINDEGNSKEVKFIRPLMPGAWTDLEVILDAVPPTSLGFVRVKDFSSGSISLRR